MINDQCKKCRRAGQKLFLKGEKCFTPKCPVTRKPYAPGFFGKKRGKHAKRGISEYGAQLREKQDMKFSYGLRERQFQNYIKKANSKTSLTAGRQVVSDPAAILMELLESRLDNAVFRLGFAESRTVARQMVLHGHIKVNSRKVNIPSYGLKIGDKISIRPESVNKGVFKDIDVKLKKYNPPSWIKLDKEKKEGEILGPPATTSS